MFTYTFDNKINILRLRAVGENEISELIYHYRKIVEYKSFTNDLKILIDARESQMMFSPDDLKKVFLPLAKAINTFNSLTEAILVSKPAETAIATLFELEYTQLKGYEFKIFSTKEAAVNWLINS